MKASQSLLATIWLLQASGFSSCRGLGNISFLWSHGRDYYEVESDVPSGPEEEKFDLRFEMGSKDFILAAKFHTKRVLNVEAIARNFSQLWHTRNGFKIKD